ncbi:dual specificity mitogen-activated protein kinase kinase 5 isoform X2 [Lethenteron reissneri]|uniref:dual specificity mitogen-activated protein kinase kinase 5 isoform X2 n=1 Tax=Lethenteron reissneri TaxID=7753 RepID=UPI002AB6BF05|nr:dual specificity mitogen-activated protein kinase kinase 5 isoform X2 [Lethenteron reissneri]
MDERTLVIRIKTPDGNDVDWSVDPIPQLYFRDVLDVISQVLPEATTTAFEYEDEDGDRITVRSDDEMKAMLAYYLGTMHDMQMSGEMVEPLNIYPRACKPPGKRNIHGLKVNTRAGPGSGATASTASASDSGGGSSGLPTNSLKKPSAELNKILANEQISEQDIEYQDMLGHGNGGTVYKANHLPSGKIMAIKVIPLDVTPEVQRQIMSELDILYKCDSSYIIAFYGAFFVENRISIATEFMDGGSLDVYGMVPEHVLGRIAVAVVKGLTYLWSLKILHRDVKPSNILVNTRGQVKLCDFGVSTQLVNSIAKTYVGTNAYMAPERIAGEQYGIHSDVWSLGISFMENPPTLPAGQFCAPFEHFITQCMRKLPTERPAPEDLMVHQFIKQFDDGNTEVVSMWVCRSLEERRANAPV